MLIVINRGVYTELAECVAERKKIEGEEKKEYYSREFYKSVNHGQHLFMNVI